MLRFRSTFRENLATFNSNIWSQCTWKTFERDIYLGGRYIYLAMTSSLFCRYSLCQNSYTARRNENGTHCRPTLLWAELKWYKDPLSSTTTTPICCPKLEEVDTSHTVGRYQHYFFMSNTKWTLKTLQKTEKLLPRWQQFCQIWSQWLISLLWGLPT